VPEYIYERTIVKRQKFSVFTDNPENVERMMHGPGAPNPISETIETDVQISLADAPKQKRGKSPGKNGTRIPPDWAPDIAYAKSKGMHDNEIDREAEKFRNYWSARAGAGGVKLDWARTWFTWCLTFCERAGRAPQGGGVPSAASMSDAQWNKALDLYWSNQRWHRDYGPEPGRPGCKVPVHLLPVALRGSREMKALPSPDLFVR
jgi:hypothetical protein